MKRSQRVPISVAREVAQKNSLRQVILVAWDGKLMHVVTYGVSQIDCDQAAMGGNFVKKALGWPESLCNSEPPRVTKLRKENSELRGKIKELEAAIARLTPEPKTCVKCCRVLTPEEHLTSCRQCGELVPISQGSDPGDDPDYAGY